MTEPPANLLVQFQGCRTTEDYFHLLEVPYDRAVVAVHRLPILRHFVHQIIDMHLHRQQPEHPDEVLAAYRAALIRSYRKVTESTATDHQSFEVPADPRALGAFAEARTTHPEEAL